MVTPTGEVYSGTARKGDGLPKPIQPWLTAGQGQDQTPDRPTERVKPSGDDMKERYAKMTIPELEAALAAGRARSADLRSRERDSGVMEESKRQAVENVELRKYINQRKKEATPEVPQAGAGPSTPKPKEPEKPPQGAPNAGAARTFADGSELGSRERIVSAFAGISHSPERFAQSAIEEYAANLNRDYESVAALAKTPEQRQVLEAEMARFKEGYTQRYQQWLGIVGRQMSAHVSGPARFPVARQEKLRAQEREAVKKMEEWRKRTIRRISGRVANAYDPTGSTGGRPSNPTPRKNIIENDIAVVERDVDENRIRLRFNDGKPSDAVRDRLKRSGWRWSPKNSAWQRMNTENTVYSARSILEFAKQERDRV